jgi:hypothetical protein
MFQVDYPTKMCICLMNKNCLISENDLLPPFTSLTYHQVIRVKSLGHYCWAKSSGASKWTQCKSLRAGATPVAYHSSVNLVSARVWAHVNSRRLLQSRNFGYTNVSVYECKCSDEHRTQSASRTQKGHLACIQKLPHKWELPTKILSAMN